MLMPALCTIICARAHALLYFFLEGRLALALAFWDPFVFRHSFIPALVSSATRSGALQRREARVRPGEHAVQVLNMIKPVKLR